MTSQVANKARIFPKAYRWGMIGLLGVTFIAAGGRLMWEWLSPKPEPTLSAQFTREYFDRFSRLGVVEVLNDRGEIEVVLDNKGHLSLSQLQCTVQSNPSGDPWPPKFDVEREGRKISLYGDIDKDRFSLPEYHDAVAQCVDAGLAAAAHAQQARPTWGSR